MSYTRNKMETLVTIIGGIATIIGAIGGWEMIKYFLNRKTNKRKEEAEADSVEFGVLRDTVEFLQQQLHDKEERFAAQTDRLRKVQDDYFAYQVPNLAGYAFQYEGAGKIQAVRRIEP